MDIIALVKQLVNFFIPVLKNNSQDFINNNFSESINNEIISLWEKIKPLFNTNAEKENVENFESKPENDEYQNLFIDTLVGKIYENDKLKTDLIKFVNRIIGKGNDNIYLQDINNSDIITKKTDNSKKIIQKGNGKNITIEGDINVSGDLIIK